MWRRSASFLFALTSLLAVAFSNEVTAQITQADEKVNAENVTSADVSQGSVATPGNDPATDQHNVITGNTMLRRFKLGQAKGDWLELLTTHIPELSSDTDPQIITPAVLRKLRHDIEEILATEGYFSPIISFGSDSDVSHAARNSEIIHVNVDAGARTKVKEVNLTFSGALADAANAGKSDAVQRRDELIKNWGLSSSSPFRDAEWSQAKNTLTESLRSDVYASASILESSATVDADAQSCKIDVSIDSGPPFTLGDMNITGLQRYPAWLLERFQPPKKGEPYSRARLLEYQSALQNSAYFATVAVSVDPDPEKADSVPVDVSVVERRARDLGFGAGYSSNTGFRTEVTYRDRNVWDKAWDLRSAVRVEQKRQLAYADIYLPPRDNKALDSFGGLYDKEDISGLLTTRAALGVKRVSTHGHLEQRLGLNFLHESTALEGTLPTVSKALVTSIGWTWRDVDDSFSPRKGQIAQLDLAISEKALLSDQRFIRAYGKYQRWIPVGQHDSIILRAELGQVFAPSSDGIPEEYLFRTGGSSTVRGYSYQSLGIQYPTGVTGGSVMGVASVEYDHWLQDNWGVAVFADAGDAADGWKAFRIKQGVGVGARYKTPAGPIALDLAYGKSAKQFRLGFSIAIAF